MTKDEAKVKMLAELRQYTTIHKADAAKADLIADLKVANMNFGV